ncbi:unnamed protein product [Agarophyton chilense]|eukprot:gb/GEZJ01004827.1/.p1 GENE.gb/GEZJ01004827.1/~~gb/GEZJ01004827.1/.p1  ORF type:complete len:414 (-),score=55.91 gb/GEZJ01004827.1/:1695-2936(-)
MVKLQTGDPLGGFAEAVAELDSIPTLLAVVAILLASLQGVLCLESVDSCRLSRRKLNILLSFEVVETIVLFLSELLSFLELRTAFRDAFPDLHFVAPCLFAAGVLQIFSDIYFTLAVVTKSRISWIPVACMGSNHAVFEVVPLSISIILSVTLLGWRFRWWLRANAVSEEAALSAIQAESSLGHGVIAFAAGWTVAISALLIVIMVLSDCGEEGPSYFAGLRYLWRPEMWLDDQHVGSKVWYRRFESTDKALDEYMASALLDEDVPLPNIPRQVRTLLERAPLHIGNAIVGTDKQFCVQEDRIASRLQKLVLIAEHLVVLPLLVVIVVIVARNHDNLDQVHYVAIAKLAEGAIVLAFVEFAIGIKNLLWGVSGTVKGERANVSGAERVSSIRHLRAFSDETQRDSHDLEIKID